MVLTTLVVTSSLTLTACAATSASKQSRHAAPTANSIPIPPVHEAPAATVVPGPTTCPASFEKTLRTASDGAPFTLTSQRTSHLITCAYHASAHSRTDTASCTQTKILINTEPQAFTAFNRWTVETGQNSIWSGTPALAPRPVPGIGIEAEWVPASLELGTGDATTWASVILTCPANAQAVRVLAEKLAIEALASTA
jgi:hypothetical protein